MTAPTGLYGWIQSNDGRSTGLFVGFLATIQLIAPLALILPLLLIDLDHAPFFHWLGYLCRYAPLVLIGSVAWFAAQLWWHVETVKRAVGFEFVDASDEPRLCRVIEPLLILTGLPVPFVGVIESDARNAFACGIGHRKAVVVVTRGLLDALSDAELAAVLAHELSHIKNGDIRLMAAANIFMSALTRLHARNVLRFTPLHGVVAVAVPALLPLSLVGTLIGRLTLRAGQVSRLLIASSREFIADAQAAQWTQDPGALAAALLKVDGRHRIAHARAEDDAMMIAGESSGADATHPTVAQRVAALARVTGSMVFNAPAAPREGDWTPTTPRGAVERLAFGRRGLATQAIARSRQGSEENILGLTRGATLALVLTIGALVGIHWTQLGDARAMAAKFDPRPLATLIGVPAACERSPFSASAKAQCDAGRSAPPLRRFEGQGGTLVGWLADIGRSRRARGIHGDGLLIDSLAGRQDGLVDAYRGQSGQLHPVPVRRSEGMYVDRDGSETHAPPVRLAIAEIDRLGCFLRDPRPIERDGPIPLDRPDSADRIARIRLDLDMLGRDTRSRPADLAAVSYYLDRRETLVDESYALHGRPGLDAIRTTLESDDQRAAVDRLRAAALDPAVVSGLAPVRQAKLRALLRDPAAFVPCRSLAADRS